MAPGKFNFLASSLLLLCLLGFASTAPTSNSKVGSVDKKKVFITGDRIEVIISSTKEDTNVSLKQILQRLESVNAENKKLVKDVQALEGRIQTLENKGDLFVNLFRQQCGYLQWYASLYGKNMTGWRFSLHVFEKCGLIAFSCRELSRCDLDIVSIGHFSRLSRNFSSHAVLCDIPNENFNTPHECLNIARVRYSGVGMAGVGE